MGTYLVVKPGRSRALAVAKEAEGPGLIECCPVGCVHPQRVEDHPRVLGKDRHYLGAVPAAKTVLQCLQQSGHFSVGHLLMFLIGADERKQR